MRTLNDYFLTVKLSDVSTAGSAYVVGNTLTFTVGTATTSLTLS